jgi:hypothetical protein
MTTLPYREGTVFLIPLREGGYATGVVARVARQGKIVLVYLFGPRRDKPPMPDELLGLSASDALKCLRVGDLGLLNGEWPVVGSLPDWQREEWPTPLFLRRDDLSQRAWIVHFDDEDPSQLQREEVAAYNTTGLERQSLYGYGAVELLLTTILRGTGPR